MRPRALVAVLAVSAAAAAPLVAHAADPAQTTRLTNSVLAGLAKATDLGAVAPGQRLHLTVALAHPDPAGEQAALAAVYDKSSPSYHHFYAPTEWAQRFGVPDATFQRVRGWLTRDGLSVGYAAPTRTLLSLTGSAAQVERTFDVALHNYRFAGLTFRANKQAATVPVGVTAIRGLETASAYRLPARTTSPAQDSCVQRRCLGTLTPQDLWSAYDQPSGNRGLGVKVGIIGEGDTTTTIQALRRFEATNSLPHVNVKSVFVADDRTDDSGKGEWQLDSQAIQGMAPDIAELDFYFSQDFSTLDNALSAWANESSSTAPTIANESIGGCEAVNVALGGAATTQGILTQLASEGRTLFVSTGDTGGSCAIEPLINLNGIENTGVPSAQWPSTSDAVVAVGGTVLYTNGANPPARTTEYTWTHSGGGTSFFVPRPAWQSGISVIQGRCAANLQGHPVVGDTPCRGVPDVSAVSGDILTNGYATVDENGAQTFGAGTSLSSPLVAGMWARVQAASGSAGTLTPLGLASPLLYGVGLDPTKDVNDFFDITVGSNVQWTSIPRNDADPTGWDYTNGLGVPQVTSLMQDIDGSVTPVVSSNPAPAADQVVVLSGGGGGPTCGQNGVVSDPTGDDWLGAGVNTGDTDLTQVVASYSSATNAVTWTAHVVNLAAVPEAKTFEFYFSYAGTQLDLNTSRDVLGNEYTELDSIDATGSLNTVATTGLTAQWNDAANTVSVTMPVTVYNGAVHPTPSLAAGATLSGLDYFADRTTAQSQQPTSVGLLIPADEAPTSCGFVLQ